MRSTTILLALLPAFCALPRQASAQGSDSVGYIPRLNIVKIGGSSGFASTLALSYERVLKPDLSVALTVSYMLPIKPTGLLNLETDDLVISGDRELKGVFITPEVKWYVERSDPRPAPRGFYVGAYMRWSDMRYTSTITGESEGSTASGHVESDLQIDLTELGFGIDAGYQLFMFKDRIAVDFIFFGPRYSIYTLKVDAHLDGEGQLLADLEESLEKWLGRDVAPVDVSLDKSGSTSSSRNSMGYRAGFKIGYAF